MNDIATSQANAFKALTAMLSAAIYKAPRWTCLFGPQVS
jgi:hypothetical protein